MGIFTFSEIVNFLLGIKGFIHYVCNGVYPRTLHGKINFATLCCEIWGGFSFLIFLKDIATQNRTTKLIAALLIPLVNF